MKDWQKGIELYLLKQIADIYKPYYKEYTYGAFGTPKERDVAIEIEKKCIVWDKEKKNSLIYIKYKNDQTIKDFSGRPYKIGKGNILVRHISGDGKIPFLNKFIDSIGIIPYIEIFPEDLQFKKDLEDDGYNALIHKVMASSDIKCIYSKKMPENPVQQCEKVGITKMLDSFISVSEGGKVLSELNEYLNHNNLADHYSGYNKRNSWKAISLQGFKDDPEFIIKPSEMSKKWKKENADIMDNKCRETDAYKHFPFTRTIIDKMQGKKQRIRFMFLSAEIGELSRHADITDPESGVQDNCIARLHIPLKTNSDVYFENWMLDGEKETIKMTKNDLFYLDTRKPHRAVNVSKEDRIHLVMDTYSSEYCRELLSA